jgi:hypothetical protein
MVALVISSLKPIEKIFLTILNLNLNYKEFRAEQEIILLFFKITKSS